MGRATIDGRLNPMVSAHDYYDYREQARSFDSLAAISGFPARVTVAGKACLVHGPHVGAAAGVA